MSLAVARQEHDRQARDGAVAQRRRRLAPRALDHLVADVFQPRQVVDAGSADNAKHSLCHELLPVSGSADRARSQSARNVRLYCGAIINRCSPMCGSDSAHGFVQGSSMPSTDLREKRQSIIDACLRMNQLGINQGTSGNISLRHDDGLLITPTSVPYEAMQPEQIVFMNLDGSFDPPAAPVERMALPSRYPQSAPRGERGGSRPPALFDHARDHGSGDSAGALHDRLRRRRHHPLRALRDLRHRRNSRSMPSRRSRTARPACWRITA